MIVLFILGIITFFYCFWFSFKLLITWLFYDKIMNHLNFLIQFLLDAYILTEAIPYKLAGAVPGAEQLNKIRSLFLIQIFRTLPRVYKILLYMLMTKNGVTQYIISRFDAELVRRNILRAEPIQHPIPDEKE